MQMLKGTFGSYSYSRKTILQDSDTGQRHNGRAVVSETRTVSLQIPDIGSPFCFNIYFQLNFIEKTTIRKKWPLIAH